MLLCKHLLVIHEHHTCMYFFSYCFMIQNPVIIFTLSLHFQIEISVQFHSHIYSLSTCHAAAAAKLLQSCPTLCDPMDYAAAKSLQSCPTLCDPIEGSPPGSPVPGILQARTLEWVAISFSSAWKWKVKVKLLSHVRLLATPWFAAYQAPLSIGLSRQEYWSGVPLPSPRDMEI